MRIHDMITEHQHLSHADLSLQKTLASLSTALSPTWQAFDDATLATMTHSLALMIEQRDEEYRSQTEDIRRECQAMQLALAERIRGNGGYALSHDTLRIELDQKFVPEKRIDVLRQLEGLVPDEELSSALTLVQPAPEWRANGTKLRALARKYGGRVAQIIQKGMPHVPVGPTRLILEPKKSSISR
jgi:hypothetical protein